MASAIAVPWIGMRSTSSTALMTRLSRLALLDSRLMRGRSPKVMSASRRRRNDRTNRPIRTGTPRNHHRYSGAANRIRPPRDGARSALDLWASWNLPQQGGRQGQIQENENRPRVEKPRELFGVAGVAG